jgi:hypothetical protein
VSHSVLVIDDAETLAASALRYLTKLCRRGGMGGTAPQIVLIGAPAMWPLLRQIEHRRLADRIGVRLRINRLTTSEARLYIERRLWVAGSETRKVLSPAAFAEIVARTEGIPGRINAALERVFAAGFEQGHARVTPQTVRSALGITRPPTIRTKASAGAPPIWLIAGSCLVVGLGAALYANSDSLPSASDLFARFGISLPTLFAPASTGGGKP